MPPCCGPRARVKLSAIRLLKGVRYGRGINVGHNQVSLIISRLVGIQGLPERKLLRAARRSQSDSLDLVRRRFTRFTAEAPDRP